MTSSADAHAAGLRFSNEGRGGIRRRRSGRGFSYRGADGALVRDAETLARIRSLVIPPAWTDVWICPEANGHLQATGRDARGRKQYKYHPRWRSRRDRTKFDRLSDFGRALPAIRAAGDADLARRGLPREKVLAAIVRLLESTVIRIGNEEYARLYRSFGLTTLRHRHVKVDGSSVRFRFRGKSGKPHDVDLSDRRLAAVVRRCQDLPGQELFQYVDADGVVRDVHSEDVNDYLRSLDVGDFTAKDFRTWSGTLAAFRALQATETPSGEGAARRQVADAIRETADALGNTPAVARSGYVHPAVIKGYLAGAFPVAETDAGHQGPASDDEIEALIRFLDDPRPRRRR